MIDIKLIIDTAQERAHKTYAEQFGDERNPEVMDKMKAEIVAAETFSTESLKEYHRSLQKILSSHGIEI